MLRQPPAFYSHRAHGDLLSRLTNDANQVEQAVFYGCAPLLREPFAMLFLLGYCFYSDPKLALFTFVIVPVGILPLARFARRLVRISRKGQDSQGAINAVCYEALAGIRVVQAFTSEAHESQKLDRVADRYFKQMRKSYFIRAVRTPTMEFLGAVALGALLGLLGWQVRSHNVDPASYVSFFVAVVMMYDPLKKLGNVSDYLASGQAAASRIFEIIDAPLTVVERPGAALLPPFAKSVVFEQVGFAYDGKPVLSGFDLELGAGRVVALVGPTGSGKTTAATSCSPASTTSRPARCSSTGMTCATSPSPRCAAR